MSDLLLLRGILIGVSIAAPVGPIGVLCIRRTLTAGRASGLATGLGAASADALYGTVAAFGLALIGDLVLTWQHWLRLVGGLYLLYLGSRVLVSRVREEAQPAARWGGVGGAYASSFLLTLTNPATILSFAGVLAGLGVAEYDARGAGLLVLGVFAGSAIWWLFLSVTVGLLQDRVNSSVLRWVNRLSGVAIAAFGAYALVGVRWSDLCSR